MKKHSSFLRHLPLVLRTSSLVLALAASTASAQQLRTLGKPEKPRFDIPEIIWPAAPGEAEICLWKDDKYAAISITIDDNCRPDHDWWLEQAEKHGFKLTWFVITERVDGPNRFYGTWADWQRLADAWRTVRATQGGNPVRAVFLSHDGHPYALVDAVPDRGEIAIVP